MTVPSAVNGRLPRTPPIIEVTQRTSRRDTPPRPIRSPAKMKKGTASRAYLSMLLNITWCMTVAGAGANATSTTAAVASRITKNGNPSASSASGSSARTQVMPRGC